MTFLLGDLAICESDTWVDCTGFTCPIKGQILTIRSVDKAWGPSEEGAFLRFEEITNKPASNGKEPHFNAKAFRRVDKPNIEVFHDILQDWQKRIG